MENAEAREFSVKPAIEKQPFQDAPTRAFFSKWCEVNDSIEPKYVSREEWNGESILSKEKNEDGKQELQIPLDLGLHEIVRVIEAVDKDTYAHNPGKMRDKRKELGELGDMFVNAGIYLAQNFHSENVKGEGADKARRGATKTAIETARDFYRYGNALRTGDYGEQTPIEEIADNTLSPKQTEEIDTWFGVDKLAALKKQEPEQARQEMLGQFFKVTEQAKPYGGMRGKLDKYFGKKKEAEKEPYRKALKKVHEKYLEEPIKRPERELHDAVFRRGLEKLVQEMGKEGWTDEVKAALKAEGFDVEGQQRNLMETLEISRLKQELDFLRSSQDNKKIGDKERQIADIIQKGVSSFPFKYGANNPSEMIADQLINCVGASTLGGALMKEAGLHYLVGDVPEHSILFLVTADGQVEWRDMRAARLNGNLEDEYIHGSNSDGSLLRVADIVAFSENPSPEGLMFDIKGEEYRKRAPWVEKGQRQYVAVFEPELGQKIQIMDNTGVALNDMGNEEESWPEKEEYYNQAIEAYLQAMALNPKNTYPYTNMGMTLNSLGRASEALEAYRKAVVIDPEFAEAHNGIGNSLDILGRADEALEAYGQAIDIDPKFAHSYNGKGNVLADLGHKAEAIEAYQKFIDLADKEENKDLLVRARVIIAKLKKDIGRS
jgi:tetratricopeptide (TPR) repeat protein